MKQIPDQLQRQIWATEQEILDVIHQVCTEYGLRYSLAYGTLIGAVRHKGFIPWDDDIRHPFVQFRSCIQVGIHTAQTFSGEYTVII